MTPAECTPKKPCRHWRDCTRCAAARQARVANLAESLEKNVGQLALTVLTPRDQSADGIAAARRRWRDANDPIGAIWTVEQGRQANRLHLNLLHAEGLNVAPSGCETWQSASLADARRVAAYIAKPGQSPRPGGFAGRSSGTLGPMWRHMLNKRRSPVVAAAALQLAIDRSIWCDEALMHDKIPVPSGPRDHHYYRAVAARYIPDLLALTTKRRM